MVRWLLLSSLFPSQDTGVRHLSRALLSIHGSTALCARRDARPSTTAFGKMGITLQNLTCSSGRPGNSTGAAALLPSEPPHESSTHPIPSRNLDPRRPGPAEVRWATESPRPLGPAVLLTETRRTKQRC